MTEVHELLATNPAIQMCKYGLLDENMNILQVAAIVPGPLVHFAVTFSSHALRFLCCCPDCTLRLPETTLYYCLQRIIHNEGVDT